MERWPCCWRRGSSVGSRGASFSTTVITIPAPRQRVAIRRLWWVAPLTIIAASIANLIVYAIAAALFDGPGQFPYLTPLNIFTTASDLIVAAIVFALIGRFATHPIRAFRIMAIVALLLSFAAPLSATGLTPPADTATVAVLLVMHVVAVAITIGSFTTLAQQH